jgi:hypothetical protein
MSLPIHVNAYSGFKANERPLQFVLDDEIYEIAAVLDQWYEPSVVCFKVQSNEGKVYLLGYDEPEDEWTLQSGFDGDELLARPSIELVTVDSVLQRRRNSKLNRANTVILPMPKFRSITSLTASQVQIPA